MADRQRKRTLAQHLSYSAGRWLAGLSRRAFKLSGTVSEYEEAHGKDQSTFAPEEYGSYAAKVAAVYAATDLRAKMLAGLPLKPYTVADSGEREEVTSGRLYDLLRKPNPFWTANRFWRMQEMTLCLWGEAFAYKNRGQSGAQEPSSLWWLRPDKMRKVPAREGYLKGFIYAPGTSEETFFTPGEIVWWLYPNPMDEYAGLSPLASARLAIDTGTEAMRSNRQLFSQGMQLAGVMSPADKDELWDDDDVKRLEADFSRRFKGADKSHRLMILGRAAQFANLTMSPKDAEFLGLMRWSKGEVATVFGVPPELLGDHERATYSNITQAYTGLWTTTLLPEATFLADGANAQLLPDFGGQADECEFDTSKVKELQADQTQVVEQASKWFEMGVPLNRLLQEHAPNLLPTEGDGYGWGDTGFVRGTLKPVDLVLNPPAPPPALAPGMQEPGDGGPPLLPPPPPDEEPAPRSLAQVWAVAKAQLEAATATDPRLYGSAAHETLWRGFVQRAGAAERRWRTDLRTLFGRQESVVLRRLRAGRSFDRAVTVRTAENAAEEPFDLAAWGRLFAGAAAPILEEGVEAAANATWGDLGATGSFDVESEDVQRFLRERAQRFATGVNATTWDALRGSLGDGIRGGEGIDELAQRVRAVFHDASTWRAETIARTEAIGAANGGALLAAKQTGLRLRKSWLAALDERTRESHAAAHGQTVALSKNFTLVGGSGPAPGQIGVAEEDINCRCTLIFEEEGE